MGTIITKSYDGSSVLSTILGSTTLNNTSSLGLGNQNLLVPFFGEVDLGIHLLQYFCTGVDVESPESDTGPANTSDSFLNKSNTVFDFVDDEEVTEATKNQPIGTFLPRGRSFQKRADTIKEKQVEEERDQVSGSGVYDV